MAIRERAGDYAKVVRPYMTMRPKGDAPCANCSNPSPIRYVLAEDLTTANDAIDTGHYGFCAECCIEWLIEQRINLVTDASLFADTDVVPPFHADLATSDTDDDSTGSTEQERRPTNDVPPVGPSDTGRAPPREPPSGTAGPTSSSREDDPDIESPRLRTGIAVGQTDSRS